LPSVSSSTPSDFVVCGNFVFRPNDIDGFSHQTLPDESGVTIVNFRSYTQTIRDTDRQLFEFLLSVRKPVRIEKAEESISDDEAE